VKHGVPCTASSVGSAARRANVASPDSASLSEVTEDRAFGSTVFHIVRPILVGIGKRENEEDVPHLGRSSDFPGSLAGANELTK
jgi:hypothetical protein